MGSPVLWCEVCIVYSWDLIDRPVIESPGGNWMRNHQDSWWGALAPCVSSCSQCLQWQMRRKKTPLHGGRDDRNRREGGSDNKKKEAKEKKDDVSCGRVSGRRKEREREDESQEPWKASDASASDEDCESRAATPHTLLFSLRVSGAHDSRRHLVLVQVLRAHTDHQ